MAETLYIREQRWTETGTAADVIWRRVVSNNPGPLSFSLRVHSDAKSGANGEMQGWSCMIAQRRMLLLEGVT